MRFLRLLLRLIKYVILIGIVLVILWFWKNNMVKEEPVVNVSIPVVRVISPEYSSIKTEVLSGGIVLTESTITILPQVGGRLDELLVEEGDTVKKGDLIGKIDTTSYQLQVDQAKAAYISAESSFKRVENLFNSGAATQQTLDQTRAQYEAYLSQYELAQLQMSYTDIISPVQGTVLIRHATNGELVGPQVPIVTIADLDRLLVSINIPEVYYEQFLDNNISVSMRRADFPDRVMDGDIVRVAAFIDPSTKTFEVTCSIDDPQRIIPGMYLEVICLLEQVSDIYVLPFDVFANEGVLWYVDSDTSTAHQARVEPRYTGEDRFSISTEMKDYLFIIDGHHFLKDGQEVLIISERE